MTIRLNQRWNAYGMPMMRMLLYCAAGGCSVGGQAPLPCGVDRRPPLLSCSCVPFHVRLPCWVWQLQARDASRAPAWLRPSSAALITGKPMRTGPLSAHAHGHVHAHVHPGGGAGAPREWRARPAHMYIRGPRLQRRIRKALPLAIGWR